MVDIPRGFASTSLLTPTRRDEMTRLVSQGIEEERKRKAEAAAMRTAQARQFNPEHMARQRAVEDQMGILPAAPRLAPMEEPLILSMEEAVQRQRDVQFFVANPRTATWALGNDTILTAHDDLETIAAFENLPQTERPKVPGARGLLNDVLSGGDAILDNARTDLEIKNAQKGATLGAAFEDGFDGTLEKLNTENTGPTAEDAAALEGQIVELTDQINTAVGTGRLDEAQRLTEKRGALQAQVGRFERDFKDINEDIVNPAVAASRVLRANILFKDSEQAKAAMAREEDLIRKSLKTGEIERRDREAKFPKSDRAVEFGRKFAAAEADGVVAAAKQLADLAVEDPVGSFLFLSGAVAQSGMALVPALFTSVLTKNPAALGAVAGLSSAEASRGFKFQEVLDRTGHDLFTDKGVTDFLSDPAVLEAAQDKAEAYGIVIGLFDAVSVGAASIAITKNPLSNMVFQTIAQGLFGSGGEAFATLAAGDKIDWKEVILEGMAEMVLAPLEVSILGGRGVRAKLKKAGEVRERRKMFDILSGKLEASKLKKRDRKAFAAAIEAVTKDGPMESVYVDPAKMDTMFQDGSLGMTRSEFFASMPDLDEADFLSALRDGSDYVIPMSVYASAIAGTTADVSISQHIRLAPEDMSSAEMEEFVAEFKKNVAALEKPGDVAVNDLSPEAGRQFERVSAELRAAGQPPSQAHKEATLLMRRAVTAAQRSGLTLDDFVTRYTLPIIRGETDDAPVTVSRPTLDINVVLEMITSDNVAVENSADIVAIRDLLGEQGIDMAAVTLADIMAAVDTLEAQGVLQAQLPDEVRGIPSVVEPVEPGVETFSQTVTLRIGNEDPADWGIFKTGKPNKVRDVALKLEARQRALYGKTPRSRTGPKTIEKFAQWMADEIEYEMQTPEKSALGWYSVKYQRALEMLGRTMLPELADDTAAKASGIAGVETAEDARIVFTMIMAVNSNGTNVLKNTDAAVEVFQALSKGDGLAKKKHKRAAALNDNMKTMLAFVEENGTARAAQGQLMRDVSVKEVNAERKRRGTSAFTGYPAEMSLPWAAVFLGPKLSAFYANLSGAEGYLTMDLWWTRTINRYRGDVLPKVTGMAGDPSMWSSTGEPQGVNRIKHIVGRPDMTDSEAIEIIIAAREAYEKSGWKDKTELNKASNTLWKALFDELDEAPRGAQDRRFMIKVAEAARQEVARRTGELLSTADVQALVWYYEKRLLADLHTKPSLDISYEEAVQMVAERRGVADTFFQDTTPRSAKTLTGLEPTSPGPVEGVRETATKYMRSAGLPVRHQSTYAEVDVARATEIARLYEEMPDAPDDPAVRAAYEALAAETVAQYEALLELGFTFEWIVGGDPYASPREAIIDMQENKHLYVFPTDSGFGTEAITPEQEASNPMLAVTEYEVDGRKARINDLFRIVHDVFGHGSEGAAFGPRGEENAWQAHVRMFSPLAARAMTTETRGQNSWVNFGPFGESNRADPKNTVFAPQKAGLLPEWVSTVGQTADVKPSVRILRDNPGGEWLARKQERAEEDMANEPQRSYRSKGLGGSVTASLSEPVMLPVSLVRGLPGAQNERRAPGDPKFDGLLADVQERGFVQDQDGNAIVVGVNHQGTPYLLEGNTRVAVAVATGVDTIRADVRWFNGGERANGPMTPALVKSAVDTETFFQSPVDRPADISDFDADNMTEDSFKRDGWFVISATNLTLGSAFDEVNAQRSRELAAQLDDLGYQYIEMRGMYNGEFDGKSFLVIGDTDVGNMLAFEYGQESILTKDGLLFADGSPNVPFDGVTFGAAAEKSDFYSVPQGRGLDGQRRPSFSLNLQFPPEADTSMDATNGVSHYGALLTPQKTMLLTHWGPFKRDVLDPAFAGTGPLPGPERKRAGPGKTFYGLHIGRSHGYNRESNLGNWRHEVEVDPRTMYSYYADPDNLRDKIDRSLPEPRQTAQYEELIKAAGYRGYFVIGGGDYTKAPLGDTAVLFDAATPVRVREDNRATWKLSGAFLDWFRNSILTERGGTPVAVYHATPKSFNSFFNLSHFGTTKAAADRAKNLPSLGRGGELQTLPVYIRLENPLDLDREDMFGIVWSNNTDVLEHAVRILRRDVETRPLAAKLQLAMTENKYTYQFLDILPGEDDLAVEATGTLKELESSAPFVSEDSAQHVALVDAIQRAVGDLMGILKEAGYDGMSYINAVEDPGVTSYITFDPEQVKSVFNPGTWDPNNSDILMQKREQKSGPNGLIVLPKNFNGEAIIRLFERRNMSTMLHETGHYFLWQLQKMAVDGIPHAIEEMQAVKQWWLGNAKAIAAEAGNGITLAQVNTYLEVGTTGNGEVDSHIHRALHEQFARGFEAYLMEGKSPSNEMRGLFESFASWLISVYKKAKELNVNIDGGIRGVFDRMLATDDEIARAFDRDTFDEMVANTARELGLDPESYAKLVSLSEEARDEAKQEVRREAMQVEAAYRSRAYRARLAAIQEEETSIVNSKRENRAFEWLANGRWVGMADAPEELPLELRLDTDILIEEHGEDVAKKLPRGRRQMHRKDTKLSADDVAGWFGFGSGAEMLDALSKHTPPKEEIAARVKARVAQELSDVLQDPEELAKKVADSMHGEKRGQLIVAELRALNRVGGNGKVTTRAMAKAIAREIIAKMQVRTAIQPAKYLASERRHAENAARLLVQNKVDEAFEEKRKQLIQHELYIASRDAAEAVAKGERLAARLKRSTTRKNLAPLYLDPIDEILDNYDFRKLTNKAVARREALLNYVAAMDKAGRSNEINIPKAVLEAAARIPYRELSVQEVLGVFDSLRNIEHMARRAKKVMDAREERERAEVVGEIRQAFRDNVEGKPFNRTPTKGEKIMSSVKGYFNLVRNADTILRRIDGWKNGGVMVRMFKRAIDEAGSVAVRMREKAAVDMEKLFSAYSQSERRQMSVRKMWPGYDQALSKWDVITVALNTGNVDNYERLTTRDVRGRMTKANVDALLATLDERDWRFVQGVWNYLNEEYWPQIAEREKRVTGTTPEKVEARFMAAGPNVPAFVTGGYYPISYDPRASSNTRDDVNMEMVQNMMSGRFGKAQTKNGHLKERAGGSGGRTVQLGLQVLFSHVNHVIHDLAYSEAVTQTWGLLRDPEIKAEFERGGLQEDLAALEMWVQDVAAGQMAGTHALSGTLRRLKSGFTLSKLAFNMSTVAVQFTGITQSMALIGTGNMMRGYSTYLFSANGRIAMGKAIKERSTFMRERETTFQRDVYDLISDTENNPVGGVKDKALRLLIQAGFWTMQKVQYYAVDVPTWLGAHHQGMAQGMSDEEAAIHADRMVARSQASGLYADRSAIERGTLGRNARQSDFIRLFTALGSYMFAKFNVANEVIGRTMQGIKDEDTNSVVAILKGISDMALLFVIEAILYNLVKGKLPGQDDEEEPEGWGEFLLRETALSIASVFPFIRDVSSSVQGFASGGAYGGIGDLFGRTGRSLGDIVLGEGDIKDFRAFVDLGALFVPGIPSTALWRIFDGIGGTGEEPSVLGALIGR